MKVSNEHLSKQDKQVVAEEAAAEKAYRAKLGEPHKGAPAPQDGGVKPSALAKPPVVAPPGAQILRQVDVTIGDARLVSHFYVIGLAPPYAGAALWMTLDSADPPEVQRREMDRRLRRA